MRWRTAYKNRRRRRDYWLHPKGTRYLGQYRGYYLFLAPRGFVRLLRKLDD